MDNRLILQIGVSFVASVIILFAIAYVGDFLVFGRPGAAGMEEPMDEPVEPPPVPDPVRGDDPPPVIDTGTQEPPLDDSAGTTIDSALAGRLLAADVENGRQQARQCTTCHTWNNGGANRVGPNLWNIVGARIGANENFNYSEAMAGLDTTWSFAALDGYLASPRNWLPDGKMAFPGVANEGNRAAIIMFLRTFSNDPLPLPGG